MLAFFFTNQNFYRKKLIVFIIEQIIRFYVTYFHVHSLFIYFFFLLGQLSKTFMENLIWDHISWVMLHPQTILQHLYKMLMWTTSYWFSYRATINIIFSFTNKHSPYQWFVKYFVTLALFIFHLMLVHISIFLVVFFFYLDFQKYV